MAVVIQWGKLSRNISVSGNQHGRKNCTNAKVIIKDKINSRLIKNILYHLIEIIEWVKVLHMCYSLKLYKHSSAKRPHPASPHAGNGRG